MIGKHVGPYRILAKLGQGGMGAVYQAEDTRLKRQVAIKMLLPRDAQDQEQERLRFLQEARATSALNHPNIVQVYEFESHADQDFIVMEYVQGETLHELVRKRLLSMDEILNWAEQMAAALGAAHAAGIVHRDIKPTNMIVSGDGVLKILDFGLARLDPRLREFESTMTQGPITEADVVMGTVPYMSPEQAQGRTVDARSDVFSAGAVLYEMLTGRRAFVGDSAVNILNKVVHESPAPVRATRPDTPRRIEDILDRCLSKDPAARYPTGNALAQDLAACRRPSPVATSFAKRSMALSVAGFVLAAGLAGWLYVHYSRSRWLHSEALPQIRTLIAKGDYYTAFDLVRAARLQAPDDLDLKTHWAEVAVRAKLDTSPPGARISYRPYAETNKPWRSLGETPIDSVEMPHAYMEFHVERSGMETFEFTAYSFIMPRLAVTLMPAGQLPAGMVFVPREASWTAGSEGLPDFFIDKFEVTNAKFRQFIDAGGYRDAKHWRQPFRQGGRNLSFEEAMKLFRDTTGRPGPAAWELGAFPKDQAEFPVAGVSWFEAAAYCESVGKVLPTEHHWRRAAGFAAARDLYSNILAHSNFANKGPARVGSYPGISPFGAYDMAGNVKEWAWNQAGERRAILGGGWSEPSYMFHDADAQDPFTRHPLYGFRCARYTTAPPPETLTPTKNTLRDYSKENPVDAKTFEIYRGMYAYDKTPLETRTELREDSAEDWTREKVSYRTVYGERMTASLYLPKKGKPPYQVVVWSGGGEMLVLPSSEAGIRREDFLYLVRTGRAVLLPVYKGTYERRILSDGPNARRDGRIQWLNDVFQSINFLESRPEVDKTRLAFYGTSLGAWIGMQALALDPRLKTGVLVGGGLSGGFVPGELDIFNFAPRVKAPVLFVNGRYDFVYPLETSQRPLFRLLGTPENQKRHALFDTGHVPALQDIMREALDWLDKYLGPVAQ